jgi:hypothetical protein
MLDGCRELALYTSGGGSRAIWRSAIENNPEPAYSVGWWNSLPLTNEAVMDEDRFNIEVRQFLKQVGITSQREIERAVREALASGQIEGKEKLKVSARIQIERVALDHEIEGEIALS